MEDLRLYAIFLTLLSLFYFTWYFYKTRSPRKHNPPPSPPMLPVIGNLHQLGKLPHRSLRELSKKYGPLMLLHLGSKPTVVVSSSEAACEVLKLHGIACSDKPVLTSAKTIFYDLKDLINLPYGEQWRKLRAIFVQELLSSKRVKSFESMMEEEMCLLMDKVKRSCLVGSQINLTATFMALANDLICQAAFGRKISETPLGKEFLEKIEGTAELFFNFTIGEFVPWLAWINDLNGFNAALDRYAAETDELLNIMIEEHLNKDEESQKRAENFVDILLEMYKGMIPGVSIDLVTVKGVILDVFGAGTETSATTLAWAMTELIRHPIIMKRLQIEVRGVMKGKLSISEEDLKKMPYLKAVIKETLRLHPPLAIYFRATREHVNVMGYDIRPKTSILINSWALHRDPSSWAEPERFLPERFMDTSFDFKGLDFSFLPFGAGRRICPGLGFAAISLEQTVANLVHKFDWALPDGAREEDLDVNEKPGFTIGRKDPLVVVATKCYV